VITRLQLVLDYHSTPGNPVDADQIKAEVTDWMLSSLKVKVEGEDFRQNVGIGQKPRSEVERLVRPDLAMCNWNQATDERGIHRRTLSTHGTPD
jgi:hypothetical protein